MSKIDGTDLELTDADGVVLDYWLGGDGETKEKWAQRVWNLCNEHKETNGKGYSESNYGDKGMPAVYARCPFCLWEEKKRVRRLRLYQDLDLPDKKRLDVKILERATIEKDILGGKQCDYPVEVQDDKIIEYKNHPSYITRTQRDADFHADKQAKHDAAIGERNAKLAYYRGTGRSDEAILITHPDLKHAMNEG